MIPDIVISDKIVMTQDPVDADESVVCDACGNDAGDDPLHFSGALNGEECHHIHLCEECGKGSQRIEIRHGAVCDRSYSVQGATGEALSAQAVMYAKMAAMDNQDEPLENYPDRLIEALARAGFVIVPEILPHEILGDAAISGVLETGNPKHCWDYLLCRVRVVADHSSKVNSALADGT
mgnify:FL=1